MNTIPYDQNDKTLVGVALEVLLYPGVTANVKSSPSFDPNRLQQNFVGPNQDITANKLVIDTNGDPHLVSGYFIPGSELSVPNIQTDFRMGYINFAPLPLRDLATDESFVKVQIGMFTQIMIRKGAAPPPPVTSGGGSDFTQSDRDTLNAILTKLNKYFPL